MTLTTTDLFCGAGGSSTGAVAAGVTVRMAANHWNLAIETHQTNHPTTDHDSADISQVDPRRYPRTDILWASPECTNHSVAKGIKRQRAQEELDVFGEKLPDEAAIRSRATMWDVPRFAEHHRYEAIIVENVVDAFRWIMFPAWLQAMELLGYTHQIVWLNSMHAQGLGLPAPQSRDRMYCVFWKRGNRAPQLAKWTRPLAVCQEHGEVRAVQAFKKAEAWGRYRAQYVYRCPRCAVVLEPAWLPAASIIDWSIKGQRIGDRKRPLAAKTRARIERGIEKHWKPIVVAAAGNTYDSASGKPGTYLRAWPTDEPLQTQSTTAQHGLAVPPLLVRGEGNTTPARPATETFGAFTASGSQFVAMPLVVNHVSGADATRSSRADEALPTLVAGGLHASLLIPVEGRSGKDAAIGTDALRTQTTRNETGLLVPLRNHGVAKPIDRTIDTVSAEGNHHALVVTNNHSNRARLVAEPLPTTTTATTTALLDAELPSLDVDDCEFRMLEPDEIKRGMAFPDEYLLLGNKREQVKQSGNAVTPPAARDLFAAVAESLTQELAAA
ncbi:DNA cytosine methyltransferase [Pseudoclavibacter sp. VKM Ac-2888]|uniref:DNA cytosine methyltransferase n=1 Tax=Pseudoclavibacter sp. VKM Ac-2888 TaxID=2783830 RepID=UPI00188DA648|nr:DNA cytosine methyltransferase [Pseudoclavibacter sp. VKM Ac-2888]MBF4549693.1 DNA cytosine methyltransferase [Pseudoclavibacter sp. VKM Ac-2888]